MNIPSLLQDVEAVFVDEALSLSDDKYWFSYLNSHQERLDVFKGKIVVTKDGDKSEIPTSDIDDVVLSGEEKRLPEKCSIGFKLTSGLQSDFRIDTVSKGGFLDVYPIHKMVRRRVVQDRL